MECDANTVFCPISNAQLAILLATFAIALGLEYIR